MESIEIIDFADELKDHIRILNTEWIEKYFSLEESDLRSLSDPRGEIIDKGGYVFYARLDNEIVGTVSLLKISDTEFELAKMAVTERCRGKGISNILMDACLKKAAATGMKELVLYTNSRLTAAIALYKKYGFNEVPLDHTHYERVDMKMTRSV